MPPEIPRFESIDSNEDCRRKLMFAQKRIGEVIVVTLSVIEGNNCVLSGRQPIRKHLHSLFE